MTILCVSSMSLHSNRGTPCHLMREMAKFVPVVYINPPHSYARWLRIQKHTAQIIDETNITILTPVLPTTFRFLPRSLRWKIVATLSVPRLLNQIKELTDTPIVLWSYLSGLTLPLHRALKAALLCYHCLDDFSAMIPEDRPIEAAIESEADLLFVVSTTLQQRYRKQGRIAVLLPNGVDVAHFSKALSDDVPIPEDLRAIHPPRIGFVGMINPLWVNTELLIDLAKNRPEWSVVMIGSLNSWNPPKSLPPNFHLLGSRPYEVIPNYLKGLDVCLIPFKDNAISHSSSPLKLYEYLAAGRMVVSTPIPDLTSFSPFVWVARDGKEVTDAIIQALPLAQDREAQHRRVKAVSHHSWEQRAKIALESLQAVLR